MYLQAKKFKFGGRNITIGVCIVASLVVILVRGFAARKSRDSRPPGSVADLVRRGQLKSDRRGMYDTNLHTFMLSLCRN